MSELGELLTAVAQGKAKPVYLIEGDEYLARGAARELSQALVPEKDRALNLVTLDAGAGGGNTYFGVDDMIKTAKVYALSAMELCNRAPK